MWRRIATLLIALAVLGVALSVGCGKGKKQAPEGAMRTGPRDLMPPGQSPEGAMPTGPRDLMPPGGAPGYPGSQPVQPAPAQPTQPVEVTPVGPPYRERYAQGELTAEELREERALQEIERQLGHPVGP